MLEDVFLEQMRKMLTERFAQLQQKVNVVLATGRIPDDLTVLGPDYKRFLEVYLGEALVQGMISATDVVRRLKRREGFAVTPDPVIPTDAITWMQARVALLGKWPRDLDSQVISVISQGLQQGSSRQVIMAELQAQIFSSYSQARLENIARTETTSAYNHGLLAGFAQPDSGVVAVQYVSILDARTTDICRARNGLVLPVDSPKLVENTPPLHYQCRSVLSPITEYAMEKLRAGDARYQQRHFGYLDDEFALNPPKTLDEAMAGWEKAPPPQAGFGQLGERAPKTPPAPTPQKPTPQKTAPVHPPKPTPSPVSPPTPATSPATDLKTTTSPVSVPKPAPGNAPAGPPRQAGTDAQKSENQGIPGATDTNEKPEGTPRIPRPAPPPKGIVRHLYGGATDSEQTVEEIYQDLELVPEGFRVAMDASGYELHITDGRITDVPEFQHLSGQQAPGWSGATWDVVPGAQMGQHMAIAYGSGTLPTGSPSVVLHEYCHAMIDRYRLDSDPGFLAAFGVDSVGLGSHYHSSDPHEFLAERMSWYLLGGQSRASLKSSCPETYKWISNWIGAMMP